MLSISMLHINSAKLLLVLIEILTSSKIIEENNPNIIPNPKYNKIITYKTPSSVLNEIYTLTRTLSIQHRFVLEEQSCPF